MSNKPIVGKPIQWLALLPLILIGLSVLFYFWNISLFGEMNVPFSEEYHLYKATLTELTNSDISMLEGNADMKFPASAHEIYAYVSGFREVYTAVRFSMKASELPTFIKTTLCDKPLENFIPTANLKNYLGRFSPYQGKALQG